MKLLHIDSSALGGYSVSRQLTADIVAELNRQTPDVSTNYHDLAAEPLPHWLPVAGTDDPAAIQDNRIMDDFLAADVVVIGAPMYNFAISSQLKAWIDRILVAGKTFSYTEKGPEGSPAANGSSSPPAVVACMARTAPPPRWIFRNPTCAPRLHSSVSPMSSSSAPKASRLARSKRRWR